MNNVQVSVEDMSPLHVHVTHNVAIFRQLGMWTDLKKAYTFVPSRKRGFVLVVKPDKDGHYQLMQGYSLYRPCGLELSWHTDRVVVFRELTMVDGVKAQFDARKDIWQVIGPSVEQDEFYPY